MGIESIPVVVKCQHCGSTIADNMAKMDHSEDKKDMRHMLEQATLDALHPPLWTSGSVLGERIAKRLVAMGHFTEDDLIGCGIQRTYAGHCQKSGGAWSWQLVDPNNGVRFNGAWQVGSSWPARDLVRIPEWEILINDSDMHIVPVMKLQ